LGCSMPSCGGMPLAYLRREVADRRDVSLRAQSAHEVAYVVDAAGRGEADGQVQCLPPDSRRPLWLARGGVGSGEQGEVEGPAADVAAVHVQGAARA
jgi:hypothetical protein